MVPAGGEAAELALWSVGDEDEGVVVEELRDGVLVVSEVLVEGFAEVDTGFLEFDEDKRESVDKSDEVRAAGIEFAADPELGGEEEVVVVRMVPVDNADHPGLLAALLPVRDLHFHALLDELVDLLVGFA